MSFGSNMSGNNPRKFKDRIALLAQKQAEGTQQFKDIMQAVAEVKKPVNLTFESHEVGEGMVIPRHELSPAILHPAHYRLHGGSLPNVNQMMSANNGSEGQPSYLPGYPVLSQGSVPSDYSAIFNLNPVYTSAGHISTAERSRGSSGGGAMRNRSGDRRWDTSPYGGDRNGYSSSLSTYLSPPPESRWRRTASDSALYQSVKPPAPPEASSEGGSPVSLNLEDLKPSADFLAQFYPMSEVQIKQEPEVNGVHSLSEGGMRKGVKEVARSANSPSCSPMSPMSPPGGSSPTYQYIPPDLESGFQNFRLDSQPQQQQLAQQQQQQQQQQLHHEQQQLSQQLPHQHLQKRQQMTNPQIIPSHHHHHQHQQQQQQQQQHPHHLPEHLPQLTFPDFQFFRDSFQHQDRSTPTEPVSPHTPSTLPGFIITDWDNSSDNLDKEFVDTMREGLEPIDDQLLATLTGQNSFVDPATEEQFKLNY